TCALPIWPPGAPTVFSIVFSQTASRQVHLSRLRGLPPAAGASPGGYTRTGLPVSPPWPVSPFALFGSSFPDLFSVILAGLGRPGHPLPPPDSIRNTLIVN